ncbi:xylose isomerase [Kiritimatiella glycovorans]|uniref:Xylose isomerase n=1 Tax=Kiritimatiella glycovorans TaxID=1307763 RepID=A0A0G3EBJ8_9BACT|nr:xylose isomerase [Kiritimatiella glycovorans]AKJ63683.1 Xylose isomerase [Kiritimatiella glycovorans]
MKTYFPKVDRIAYEGPDSRNPMAFRHYNPDEEVMGKPMREHLRFAVCFWHTFKGLGADPFGPGSMIREWLQPDDPMDAARETMHAAFEFFTKLGVEFWCFHDRDIAPEAGGDLAETNRRLDEIVDLAEQLQNDRGMKLLWGTTNAFSNRRFMAGASTNPSPEVFAWAGAQVKKAMELTHRLGGEGYVFWGGREGYETLLNTDLKRETDHLARFLHMAVDYKKKLGFKGPLYIEPKPKEPTKHQYDFDAQSVHGFLVKNGLDREFLLNIEANHATLAMHDFQHELEYAAANGMLGSVDANIGDLLLGWDTDQFPTSIYDATRAMYTILRSGGFTTGGLNFDAHVRRQSIDPEDLFYGHVAGMDTFARALKAAANMIADGVFADFVKQRYAGWDGEFGRRIENGELGFEELEAHVLEHGEPELQSGRQEMLEHRFNDYV